jgi:hypothetical protein
MKKLIAFTAFSLMCGSAFAQSTGAPANAQSNDMNKPGMNNMDKGSMNNMEKGSMNNSTTGMSNDSTSKNNPKKEMSKDGADSAGSKEMKK